MCNAALFGYKYQQQRVYKNNKIVVVYLRGEFTNIDSSHCHLLSFAYLKYTQSNNLNNYQKYNVFKIEERLHSTVATFSSSSPEALSGFALAFTSHHLPQQSFFFLSLCQSSVGVFSSKNNPLLAQLLAPLYHSFYSVCQRSVLLGLSLAFYLQF